MTKTCIHCGKPVQSKRSTKKYCSDNCKQLAFYRRSGSALPGLNSNDNSLIMGEQFPVKKPFDDNEIIRQSARQDNLNEQPTVNPPVKSLNDKQTAIANNSFTVSRNETPYQWIHSKMIDSIAGYVDNSEALFMFQQPQQYWSDYTLPTIKWVSLRLRCLLESLIKLSNFNKVDSGSILAVKEAFTVLTDSSQFKQLPANYPFTALAKELEQKLALIAEQYKDYDAIRFRLTLNRKVKLIATRFILADFVTAIKFSEMDFNQ